MAETPITGDLVEVAEDKVVSDYPGAVAIYLLGSAGDINPVVCCLAEKEGLVKLEQLSSLLAGGIREALNSTSSIKPDPLEMEAREISLPEAAPDRSLLVLRTLEAERWLKRKDLPEDLRGEIRFQRDSAAAILDHPSKEIISQIQVARLGEVLIVGNPGELFIMLGKQTAGLLPGHKVLVTSYTDDYIEYIPTPDRYDLTGQPNGWAVLKSGESKYSYDYAAYNAPWYSGMYHYRSDVGDVLVQGMVKLDRDVIAESGPQTERLIISNCA